MSQILEQVFDLPDLSAYGNGEYREGNCVITVQGHTVYVWAIQPEVVWKREFSFVIQGVPGSLPVSCCATHWSIRGGVPVFGAHKVYMRAVERCENVVRVAVEQHGIGPMDIAVGLSFPKMWPEVTG